MNKLLRTSAFKSFTRTVVPEYRPEANEEKFKSWWSRLNNLSSRPASKVYLAQLSNLLAYYNRPVKDTTQPINFPAWKGKIITKGLVESVQKNYEDLATKEYDLDKVFTDIFSKDSKSIDEIVTVPSRRITKWPSILPSGSRITVGMFNGCRTLKPSETSMTIPLRRSMTSSPGLSLWLTP
jgi:hypothetical protein